MTTKKTSGTSTKRSVKKRTTARVMKPTRPSETEYIRHLSIIDMNFHNRTNGLPLFTTDISGLWDMFMYNIPASDRQHHNCHACRKFVETFGGLVTIGVLTGNTESAIWSTNGAPAYYERAMETMKTIVEAATVSGVFLHKSDTWGTPVTGDWHHYALVGVDVRHVWTSPIKTPGQRMAEIRENFVNVQRALGEFNVEKLDIALAILNADALSRSEKFVGPVQWLRDLQYRINVTGVHRRNLIWLAVANAPDGFCHPRASMVGTLLEDILAGLPVDDIKRRFDAKMHPLRYQRPKSAPRSGNIENAEKIVAKLGLTDSLRRRFARLDEIETAWTPPKPVEPTESTQGNVFGHLKPKSGGLRAGEVAIPAKRVTFEKFMKMLADEHRIQLLTPRRGNYGAFVTAAVPDAPPILKWDSPELRNPVSWYVYATKSWAEAWHLPENAWVDVTAIAYAPTMWNAGKIGNRYHPLGKNAMFVLDGARDTRGDELALFPENLRGELHEVRATIEAFSKSRAIEEPESASACGLILTPDKELDIHVRVHNSMGTADFIIDRWE